MHLAGSVFSELDRHLPGTLTLRYAKWLRKRGDATAATLAEDTNMVINNSHDDGMTDDQLTVAVQTARHALTRIAEVSSYMSEFQDSFDGAIEWEVEWIVAVNFIMTAETKLNGMIDAINAERVSKPKATKRAALTAQRISFLVGVPAALGAMTDTQAMLEYALNNELLTEGEVAIGRNDSVDQIERVIRRNASALLRQLQK